MATREIKSGEKIKQFTPRIGVVFSKGSAVAVDGLREGKKAASNTVGSVQRRILERELESARNGCSLGESCGLRLVLSDSDSPAEAVFMCDKEEKDCGEIALRAAKGADNRITDMRSQVGDQISKLGP